jgi:NADPH:quinone reductase-like Zn-dependent oxidoreductase
MKAAVYNSNARSGVEVVDRDKPTLKDGALDPLSVYSPLYSRAFNIVYNLACFVMYFVRLFAGIAHISIPPPYGSHPNRKYVLVTVVAAGVNPVDAKWLYGDKVPALLFLIQKYLNHRICGIDFAGIVTEAQPGSGFIAGDEVFGTVPPSLGSFAEVVRVPTDFINLKPKNLTFKESAACPLVGLTIVQMFEEVRLTKGKHVLVIGASGGTGHVAVQVAKYQGK